MKKRIDLLLFERGVCESREKARTSVMSGIVFVDGQRVDKPGTAVSEDAAIELRGTQLPYVSRGGLKLEKAIRLFGIDLQGVTAADIGASTGGFSDCMLQNGAVRVYAIDVGYGQLAWKLRSDKRVVVMERTNIRFVTPEMIGEPLDFATVDVSFISLKLVMPVMRILLKAGGEAVVLVKPQFEAGRDKVGKKGVVKDPAVHQEVTETFLSQAVSFGFSVKAMTFSPIKGPEGNIEYLAHLSLAAEGEASVDPSVDARVLTRLSHEELKVEHA